MVLASAAAAPAERSFAGQWPQAAAGMHLAFAEELVLGGLFRGTRRAVTVPQH